MTDDVKIPSQAVSLEGADLCKPVRGLLEGLDLLGTTDEAKKAEGFHGLLFGPPQSVALIEAGATAASKWWAAGLGVAVIPLWGIVASWYDGQPEKIQVVLLAGASLITAALVIAIGYLIASDVRGRATAAIAVIDARTKVATSMLEAARTLYAPPATSAPPELVPLPKAIRAKNHKVPAPDQTDWLAVAIERTGDGSIKYLLVKDSSQASLPASDVEFIT